MARLALALFFAEPEERKQRLSTAAVAMARRVAEPGALAFALSVRYFVGWGPDSLDERLAAVDEIAQLGARARDREITAEGLVWRCGDLMELGDFAEFDRTLARLAALATELRQPVWSWYASLLAANRATLRGEWAVAEQHAGEALAVGNTVLAYAARVHCAGQRWALEALRGEPGDAATTLHQLGAAHPAPAARCSLIEIDLALGREAEARQEFRPARRRRLHGPAAQP